MTNNELKQEAKKVPVKYIYLLGCLLKNIILWKTMLEADILPHSEPKAMNCFFENIIFVMKIPYVG